MRPGYDRPLRVITLCSGYDSQCMALERLKKAFPGFDYELVAWSEIDRHAIKAHDAVFPQWAGRNLGDMTRIDWSRVEGDIDLLVYSTPCTSISNAGKQEGLKKGSGTASSILWATEEAIKTLRPKWLLMENVKALVSKKFKADFDEWQRLVASYGYVNCWKVLNAKDYGVPQNRERVFLVSHLGDGLYHFPRAFPLTRTINDVLEDEPDERYFLSGEQVEKIFAYIARKRAGGCGFRPNRSSKKILSYSRDSSGEIVNRNVRNIAGTVHTKEGACGNTAQYVLDPRIEQVGNLVTGKGLFDNPIRGRVYSPDGLSRTLTGHSGGDLEPKILQSPRGRNKGGEHELSPTIDSSAFADNNLLLRESRVRKLTPRECFRLMDVSDGDIDRMQASGVSRSQQYRMAGNSIVVSVLFHIFRKICSSTPGATITNLNCSEYGKDRRKNRQSREGRGQRPQARVQLRAGGGHTARLGGPQALRLRRHEAREEDGVQPVPQGRGERRLLV